MFVIGSRPSEDHVNVPATMFGCYMRLPREKPPDLSSSQHQSLTDTAMLQVYSKTSSGRMLHALSLEGAVTRPCLGACCTTLTWKMLRAFALEDAARLCLGGCCTNCSWRMLHDLALEDAARPCLGRCCTPLSRRMLHDLAFEDAARPCLGGCCTTLPWRMLHDLALGGCCTTLPWRMLNLQLASWRPRECVF